VAATAARRTVVRMENTAHHQLRAYVQMSHVTHSENPGLTPVNLKVEIEIRNTGSTPAKVMGARLGWVTAGKDEPPPVPAPYERTVDHPSSQAFLHTNAEFYVRQGLEIPADEWIKIEVGNKTLY